VLIVINQLFRFPSGCAVIRQASLRPVGQRYDPSGSAVSSQAVL